MQRERPVNVKTRLVYSRNSRKVSVAEIDVKEGIGGNELGDNQESCS